MKEILALLFVFLFIHAFGQSDDQRRRHFNTKKEIAIEGYDPVSYFDSKPVEGKKDIRIVYKGVIYAFVSRANQDKFKSNPEKYEPAYGGWCAYAMGDSGEKVKIDPETFKIVDGKLYLFYNFWGTNTLDEWNKTEKTLKRNADKNWEKILR